MGRTEEHEKAGRRQVMKAAGYVSPVAVRFLQRGMFDHAALHMVRAYLMFSDQAMTTEEIYASPAYRR
jgi:hypothetical protein